VHIATWRTREVIRSKATRRPRAAGGGATIFIDRTAGGSS